MPVVYPSGSRQAAIVLRVFTFSVFLFPTDTVIRVIGAQGYVASLVGMLLFVGWALTAVFGFHDPVRTRYPIRGALGLLWVSSLLSYAVMPFYLPNATQLLSADRYMMLLIGVSGVILVAAEHVRTPTDTLRLVRALVWGATFSSAVAFLQFWLHWDLRPTLRSVLVGFDSAGAYGAYQGRGGLVRVAGTANHPIEFGVVAATVLPLAIWLAFSDTERSRTRRWAPVLLIGLAIPMSVSRSAIVSVAVALGVLLALLPVVPRARVLLAVPFGIVGVFATTPGYLGTVLRSFTGATTDPSITNRTDNYPRVLALVEGAPWLGRGGGTYLAADATRILDNQYLMTAIGNGLFGVLALLLFFLIPPVTALIARRRSVEEQFRGLCAAVAAACLAAAVGSYTFDAFSFPQFVSVEAVVVGLCGTCYLGARRWPQGLTREAEPKGRSPIDHHHIPLSETSR